MGIRFKERRLYGWFVNLKEENYEKKMQMPIHHFIYVIFIHENIHPYRTIVFRDNIKV